jgi:transglutaminase-like putative cysteine protease
MIGAGMGYFFQARKLKVGETFHLPVFDPSTMAQSELRVNVAARETVNIRRVSYDAFRLETEMWGKPMTFWVDPQGVTLKEEGFMGLTTIRSSAARAPRDLDREGDVDFYDLTAVSVENRLPRPRRMSFLKMRLSGIDRLSRGVESLNSRRQTFRDGVMEIRRERPPFTSAYRLPYGGFDEDLKALLRPEINIQSDHEEIVRKALEIKGDRERPEAVARRMMNWVYRSLEKRPVVSIPSALEVLRTRVGDCNEHAMLLAALLRAAGVPSKISIGLVYTRDKFFYHAWNEAYIGRWITLDATLNQMPADATHVKLVEGNLDRQVEIAGFVGSMNIEILDFKND